MPRTSRSFVLAGWLVVLISAASCVQASSSRVQKMWETPVTNFRAVLGDDQGNSYILSGAHVTNVVALASDGHKLWQWDDLDSPPQYVVETLTDQGLLLTTGGMEAALLDLKGKLQWRASLRPWELDNYPPDGRLAWYVLPDNRGISGLGRKGEFLWFTRQARSAHDTLPGEVAVLARDSADFKQPVLVDGMGKMAVKLPLGDSFTRFIDSPRNRCLISGDSLLHLSPRCQVQWKHKLAKPEDYRMGGRGVDSTLVLPSGIFVEETADGELQAIAADDKKLWTKRFDHPVHNLLTVRNAIVAVWMDPPTPQGGPAVTGELQMACISAEGQELWKEATGLRFAGFPMLQYCGSQIYLLKVQPEFRDQQVNFDVTCLEVQP